MAELLIMNQDPPIDDPKAMKKGYVVDIKDDGHKWGKEEKPPLFRVIKVPGVPKEELQWLIEAPYHEDPEIEATLPCRKAKLDWDQIKYISVINNKNLGQKIIELTRQAPDGKGHVLNNAR